MRVLVGMGSCGLAAGAGAVFEKLKDGLSAAGISVEGTGCIGACYLEPIVSVERDGKFVDYVKVDAAGAGQIIACILGKGGTADAYLMGQKDRELLTRYPKMALRNCGRINPESIDDYRRAGGYGDYKNLDVIAELKEATLGGRGGAGFPTHIKWQALKDAPAPNKTVIVNADEGDPGAFMDRAILEGDPHSVLEGLFICAAATGAETGIIYVRAEYPLAVKRLTIAIQQAKTHGVMPKGFSLTIKKGAGAFVCGEETALIASLEGRRGMPRLKPPFPAQKGYFDRPSNINNVETFAVIPWIARFGGKAFAAVGTEKSKGNKVFALTGKIQNGGLIEVPMGLTLRDCIFNLGGGIKDGKDFKAVQLGGPSGGCIPESLLDTPIDYGAISATGAIMGSGGMVVMDADTCMVDMSRFFLDFTCKESCGKCVPCRVGTKRLLEMLERIVAGRGQEGDIEKMEQLCYSIKDGALCGLGQSAPNPVLTAIKYFRDEFTRHITDKKCAAKSCKALLTYSIIQDKCKKCGICKKACKAGAVNGVLKGEHTIDKDKCTKCGACQGACKFGAVEVQ